MGPVGPELLFFCLPKTWEDPQEKLEVVRTQRRTLSAAVEEEASGSERGPLAFWLDSVPLGLPRCEHSACYSPSGTHP